MIKLSVIIPTRNRAKVLSVALDSIVKQTISQRDFEVIVVDNGSTDNTKEIVASFNNQIRNLRYFYEDSPGLHVGRHKGLMEAKSEILVYGDDDIRAFPTWLEGIWESFQDPEVVLVGGKDLPDYESEPPIWIESLWSYTKWGKTLGYYSLLDFGDRVLEISPNYVWGCNFSIRKNVLLEVGGFHPDSMPRELVRYRGDGEIGVTKVIEARGLKTIYNPRASVYHLVTSKRITKKYLYHRGFLQGVTDSYTQIRTNEGFVLHIAESEIQVSSNLCAPIQVNEVSKYINTTSKSQLISEGVSLDNNEDLKRNYFEKIKYRITNRDIKIQLSNIQKDLKIFYDLLTSQQQDFNNQLKALQIQLESPPVNEYWNAIKQGHFDGFNFHQMETKNDPDLLKWVLKDNYL